MSEKIQKLIDDEIKRLKMDKEKFYKEEDKIYIQQMIDDMEKTRYETIDDFWKRARKFILGR